MKWKCPPVCGCRVAGCACSDRAAMQLYWEHMSHGQILDEGRNQGLDYVGLRFLYRFDDDTAQDWALPRRARPG